MGKLGTQFAFLFLTGFCMETKAQVLNPYFEDWHWVMIAQPYLDPDGWMTNNYNQFGGVACTPVDRVADSTGYYAHIASSACGSDAVLSGYMYQRIPIKNVKRLNVICQCDSLWGTGRCVITLLGQDYLDILYTDSIAIEETAFQVRSIDVLPGWIANNDSITIQLTAKGNIDMWDEEEDGYSVFLVDRVTANQQFLEPGRTWIYAYNVYDILPDPLVEQTIETITVGNDTLINGLSYNRLIITKSAPCGIFNTMEYLREDGGKIYRLNHDHSQEFLMIDFDETVSYPMIYENWVEVDTAMAIVDSFGVETIFDGSQVEVQYMHVLNGFAIGEDAVYKVYKNVGFVEQGGLLFPNLGTGLCDVMEGLELRCYTDGIDTLHFTPFGCYEITLGNGTNDAAYKEITLSPNPATTEVVLPGDFLVKECYSMEGQIIPIYQSENMLFIHDWAPGMYVLKLVNRYTQEAGISRIVKY